MFYYNQHPHPRTRLRSDQSFILIKEDDDYHVLRGEDDPNEIVLLVDQHALELYNDGISLVGVVTLPRGKGAFCARYPADNVPDGWLPLPAWDIDEKYLEFKIQ